MTAAAIIFVVATAVLLRAELAGGRGVGAMLDERTASDYRPPDLILLRRCRGAGERVFR
jgi:hypothetical protein